MSVWLIYFSFLVEQSSFSIIDVFQIWVCKIITSLWQYFIVANYSWILMEGMYLHNLVFLALCTDTSTIALYIALGWGKMNKPIKNYLEFIVIFSNPSWAAVYLDLTSWNRSAYLGSSAMDYHTSYYRGYSLLDHSWQFLTVSRHKNTNYDIYFGMVNMYYIIRNVIIQAVLSFSFSLIFYCFSILFASCLWSWRHRCICNGRKWNTS